MRSRDNMFRNKDRLSIAKTERIKRTILCNRDEQVRVCASVNEMAGFGIDMGLLRLNQ